MIRFSEGKPGCCLLSPFCKSKNTPLKRKYSRSLIKDQSHATIASAGDRPTHPRRKFLECSLWLWRPRRSVLSESARSLEGWWGVCLAKPCLASCSCCVPFTSAAIYWSGREERRRRGMVSLPTDHVIASNHACHKPSFMVVVILLAFSFALFPLCQGGPSLLGGTD